MLAVSCCVSMTVSLSTAAQCGMTCSCFGCTHGRMRAERWRLSEWVCSAQGPDLPSQPRLESALQLYSLDMIQVTAANLRGECWFLDSHAACPLDSGGKTCIALLASSP